MSDTKNPLDSIVNVLAYAADTYKPTGAVSFGQTPKIAGHDEEQAQLSVGPIFDPEGEVLNVETNGQSDTVVEGISPKREVLTPQGTVTFGGTPEYSETALARVVAEKFDQDGGPEDFATYPKLER